MVWIGILQYGFWLSWEIFIEYNSKVNWQDNLLECLIFWKSQVMDIKMVKIGEYVGYGIFYMVIKEMKVVIILIGYGYGFICLLSNVGWVFIRGKWVGVIGMVNMNVIMVDIFQVDYVE